MKINTVVKGAVKEDELGKVIELARLYFDRIVIVDDLVVGLKSAVVEVLVLIDARIDVVCVV